MSRSIKLIGLGCVMTLVILELIFQMLPVTTGFAYQPTKASEPALKATVPFVKQSLDWKFHQATTRKINEYGFPDDHHYLPNQQPIAIIGDSYVQSLTLPYIDTLQGQLGALQDKSKPPIYSFGVPGYSLAGYIGTAESATKKFQPQMFVFLLTKGDITDSLLATKNVGSYFINSYKLGLEFEPYTGASRTDNLMLKSALMRYLNYHLQLNPLTAFLSLTGANAKASAGDRITTEPNLVQLSNRLLDHLEQKTTARANNTIFIIDCDREKIYEDKPQPQTSPDNQLTLFAQIAQDRGYKTIDTLPIFTRKYEQTHRRIDFTPIDPHWNRDANQLVAEAVYPVIKTKLADLSTR
jgi:SGNH hydrolase-like domain, acetyltransferase AlgX